MAYKYSNEFQGSPCRYDWYQRFSNATDTGNQECTLQVFDVVEGKLKPIAYLTNLYCTDKLEVTHGDETYTIPVYTLGEASFDDEIDPLMVESKIPSFDFTLTFEHITRDYTLEELDAITKTFEDKVVKIYRGFFSYTGEFRNELGTANLSYDQFKHDLVCMGTYVIQESEYDYTEYTISCSGENLVFSVMRDTKFYSSDSYWNQRYPYPYDDDRYLLGYPADKILDGSLFGQLNYKGLPLYGKSADVEGLNTKHICDTLWVQDPKNSDDPIETWNEHIFEYSLGPYDDEYQFTQTGEPIDFRTVGVWWQNGDEVPKTDWTAFYYYDNDKSGAFSSSDTMVVPLYGGEVEVFTSNSTIYLMGDSRYLWNGQPQSVTVRWKSLTGGEPGAIRNFSVYKHGEGTSLQDIQGSHYIEDDDGMYYTEATFEIQEIGVYDLKCWYGTYQFDAIITFAITPVLNAGDPPGFGGWGETQEESYLGYHLVTIDGRHEYEDVLSFDDLSGLTYESQYFKILGWTEGTPAIPPVLSEKRSTGKVQSAEIEAKLDSQVEKTLIYGAIQTKPGRLPEGYTELEYIESTGTQYIDTGIITTQSTEINAVLAPKAFVNSNGGALFFGSANSWKSDGIEAYVWNGEYTMNVGTIGGLIQTPFSIGDKIKIRVDSNSSDSICEETGKSVHFDTPNGSMQSSRNLTIGHLNRTSVDAYTGSIKIYSFSVDNNGENILNMLPCKKSNGEVGLYDLTGAKFYGNSGTGSFVAGPTKYLGFDCLNQIALNLNDEKWDINLNGEILTKLNDKQDVLTVNSNGKAVIESKVSKFKPGDLNITWNVSTKDNFVMFYKDNEAVIPGLTTYEQTSMCTHFSKFEGEFTSSAVSAGTYGFFSESVRFAIPKELNITTSDDFKTWLKENDVIILYDYKSSTIEIPNQTTPIISKSNISITTTSNIPCYFDLTYWTPEIPGVPGEDPTPPIDVPIEPGILPFDFDWSFRSNELELQRTNKEYYIKNLVEPTDLTSLCNTWSDVTMDTGLLSYCLMNNLHIVPTQESEGVESGNWILVNGLEPNKYPFRDTEATLQATNGKYFPELADERYKINVAMVLSNGFGKNQLDIDDVTHTKETLVNVSNLSGEESESFSLPVKDRFTSSVDIDSSGNAKPSDAENGYEYSTLLPLSSDTWFDTKNVTVMNGDTEVGKLFGTDQAASSLMGGKNYAVRGNSLVAYDVLWNDKLNLTKELEQPFTLKVAKYSPTEYYVDADGNTTSEDDELTTVEATGAYYGYDGLSERMVNRSNGNWLNPLYELKWSMVDDPSLRVGTLVYVPVHNQYVETYITEQKRSFDGSGQLDCVGWAIRETDEKVLLANPVNCKGTHWAGNPNDDTKGDFVTFEWEENVGWDGLYGQLVRGVLTYESKDGFTVVTLADQFFTSGEPMAYSFNWYTLEQTLGVEVDKLAANGDFYIELFYYTYEVHGKTKFEYENIIPAHQPFSYLYAGYTVASNEVAPIAFNHYLIG